MADDVLHLQVDDRAPVEAEAPRRGSRRPSVEVWVRAACLANGSAVELDRRGHELERDSVGRSEGLEGIRSLAISGSLG